MRENTKIKEMFLMQQKLNDDTNGINWEGGYTKDNKLINWRRCIYMECAELIDSFPWKHWKDLKKDIDIKNIQIEIVDIWHFLMSLILEDSYKKFSLDEIVENVCSTKNFKEFCFYKGTKLSSNDTYEVVNDIEVLVHKCSGYNFSIHSILSDYFRICMKCGLNLDILFKIYVAKNVLNKFRQDNGYKDGTYKKIWNNLEDNEVLNNILEEGVINLDEIYARLEKEYKKC